jgi:diketogulonate reductase-like aldo/keto reductase
MSGLTNEPEERMETISANGAAIPALGFGTFRLSGADVLRIVPHALKLGFRHVDTAQIYGNEAEVGEAIAASGVARDQVFLTTKVWVDKYRAADFRRSVEESLRKLRTDHVDLLLLHWPSDAVPLGEQIAGLNEASRSGKARHIGISNFTIPQMEEAAALSAAPLVTNQVEFQPFLDQSRLLAAARKAGLCLTGYYAMANGDVLREGTLQELARRNGRSVAQIVLRWVVQQGVVVLSKTVSEQRAEENLAIFDFSLSDEDMAAISGLARPDGRRLDPPGLAPDWDD